MDNLKINCSSFYTESHSVLYSLFQAAEKRNFIRKLIYPIQKGLDVIHGLATSRSLYSQHPPPSPPPPNELCISSIYA